MHLSKTFPPPFATFCISRFVGCQSLGRAKIKSALIVLAKCGKAHGIPCSDTAARWRIEDRKLRIAAVFAQQQAEQVPSGDGQNLGWKMAGRRRSLRG